MEKEDKKLQEAVVFHEDKKPTEAVVFHDKDDMSWMQAATIDVTKKSAEHRQYLVLIWYMDNADVENSFIIAEGRTNTYFAIKDQLEIIDVEKSVVMLEGNRALVDQITVLQFLRHVRDEELVEDDTGCIVDEILAEMEGFE